MTSSATPYPDGESLLAEGREAAGLADFGPGGFQDGLGYAVLCGFGHVSLVQTPAIAGLSRSSARPKFENLHVVLHLVNGTVGWGATFGGESGTPSNATKHRYRLRK